MKVLSVELVGYWTQKLDKRGVDLRLVTDKSEKSKIYERSCWC